MADPSASLCLYTAAIAAWLAIAVLASFGLLAVIEAGRQLRLHGFTLRRKRP